MDFLLESGILVSPLQMRSNMSARAVGCKVHLALGSKLQILGRRTGSSGLEQVKA